MSQLAITSRLTMVVTFANRQSRIPVYEIGDIAGVVATITDTLNETAVEPSAVTVTVRRPSGLIDVYTYGTDAELVRISAGVYRLNVDVVQAGKWRLRYFAEGVEQVSTEAQFSVAPAGIH